jgi:hypothetical protein
MNFHELAREIAAKLIPHTTSVENVLLIENELSKAYLLGANDATVIHIPHHRTVSEIDSDDNFGG